MSRSAKPLFLDILCEPGSQGRMEVVFHVTVFEQLCQWRITSLREPGSQSWTQSMSEEDPDRPFLIPTLESVKFVVLSNEKQRWPSRLHTR